MSQEPQKNKQKQITKKKRNSESDFDSTSDESAKLSGNIDKDFESALDAENKDI